MKKNVPQKCSALLALVIILLAGTAAPSFADIYRYVDASGVVHFTNTPTSPRYNVYLRQGGYRSLDKVISHYSRKFGLEEALVQAVIKVESNFNPTVVSKKGACGLMQLIPETAREMLVNDPMDIEENVRGGCRYLRHMLNRFDEDLDLALAAYNAGPGAVTRYRGIPPYDETRNYVKRVKTYLQQYRSNKDIRL